MAEVPGADVIAGCLIWYPTFNTSRAVIEAWISDLFVLPEHRCHGAGASLIETLRRQVAPGRVKCDASPTNTGALAFYERLGARLSSDAVGVRFPPLGDS